MSGCGTCTMCCKLRGVHETMKLAFEWCADCDIGHGCRRYPTRPRSCADYECVWLETQRLPPAARLEAALRPDRCRVVIECIHDGKTLLLFVDPARTDAWRTLPVRRLLGSTVAAGGRAAVVTKGPRVLFTTKGFTIQFKTIEAELEEIARQSGQS